MPPGQPAPKFKCPHCGKWRTRHTINIHLAKEADAFELPSSDSDGAGGPNNDNDADAKLTDATGDFDNSDGDLNDGGDGGLDDVTMAFGPEHHEELAHNHNEVNPGPANNIDPPANVGVDPLPSANINPPPDNAHIGAHVPLLAEVYRILHNPPVVLGQWDDPVPSDASEDGNDSGDAGSVSSNEDPPYIKREDEFGLDPEDEPHINPNLLRDFLEEYLVNLGDNEWEELHKQSRTEQKGPQDA
ncbi:hypothetical protein FRC07_008186 [Ceratobasidium sp. 392]|nr:hypothetical protein FRC07_008186 [Ceratobasidium sp. 392]